MRSQSELLAWVMVLGVFVLDLFLPEDAAVGLLYVVVLLFGLWMPQPHAVLRVAAAATALSVIEYQFSPANRDWITNVSNHALQVTVLWITAFGVYRHRQTLVAREIAERQAKIADTRLREQAALAQIGQMAAVVAHEVRNPLTGIRGAVEIVCGQLKPDAPEQQLGEEVIARIDTLGRMIEDLLLFARPRQPTPIRTALRPLVQTSVVLLRDDTAFAAVDVESVGDDVVLTADPELLKLAIHNLLINSAQAMAGRGRIVITATADSHASEIRIIDDGPGIPEAVRLHLFEPFFTTKHRGTGLGLVTARRLMEAHGGTLELTCPPSGGTTAVLRLPHLSPVPQ